MKSGTTSIEVGPYLCYHWVQRPEPRWVLRTRWVFNMGQRVNSGSEFYASYSPVRGVDTIVPVDMAVPGCAPHSGAFIEGILRLREKIAKQGLQVRGVTDGIEV